MSLPLSTSDRVLPPTPLTHLAAGQTGVLAGHDLPGADGQLLLALGLAPGRKLRLCKAGNPWIVEVRGTRIGLAGAVAEHLLVHGLEREATGGSSS